MPYNFEERYNEIREELIKQGYANKHITYSEFLAIYGPYKKEMSEKEFIHVLGISYASWQYMTYKGKRAIVLKVGISNEEKEKLKQQIVSDLIKKGYRNKKIDYKEFLSLYEPYREKLKENEFANFLGILYGNWQSIKNRGKKAIILKQGKSNDEKKELEQLKHFIVSDLRKKGYTNQKIDYKEFLSLYEPYREKLKENEFASILGMSYSNWKNIKNRGTRTTILQQEKLDDKNKELEQLKHSIVSDLREKGYTNKKIDYKEFLSLYEPYRKKLKEYEFASVLGISYSNWGHIKYQGKRATILKQGKSDSEKKELEQLKQFIVSDLRKRGYTNQRINYNEFLSLYEPYKEKFPESEFADILGISYGNWQYLKNKGGKTTILKKELSEDEKKKLEQLKQFIVCDLRKKGYTNKKIDYNEFLSLYEPYKEKFPESEFANVLGISYSSWQSIKNNGHRAIILKQEKTDNEKKELEQLKQSIVSDLVKKGYTNKLIDYKEFLRLYEPYKKKFKESEFANVLGISYGNWKSMQNNETRAIINFEYNYYIRLEHLFKENKEYDLTYFDKVSKNLGLSVSKIVEILTREQQINLEELLYTLHKRGKIFIGITRISESFIQKYGEIISDIIHKYSKSIGRKLHTRPTMKSQ